MPRRRAVTREQLEVLLALPATETELIRHWTLGAADLAAIERRRGDPNQLGFALQLCAFRYPGRLLRPREANADIGIAPDGFRSSRSAASRGTRIYVSRP